MRVDPAFIAEQRTLGWPDIHPEDYCHLCGGRNLAWHVDRELWLVATAKWAAETGREGICCPSCFARMFADATGHDPIWTMTQWLQASDAGPVRDAEER